MKGQAVALCRVSSARQRVEGNSLESQEAHVYDFASRVLNTEIDFILALDVSSKAGKNIKRKDLEEIRQYCKDHRYIKYFIVDKVNRLMREIKMFYWFIAELEMMGVKTYFADPQQQDLNNDDPVAQLKMFLAIYEAERDNKERINTTTTRMKDRTLQGYWLFTPHEGYKKSDTPGLYLPDGEKFNILQKAFKAVASGELSKMEAHSQLVREGYVKKHGRPIRIDSFYKMLADEYYAGFISIPKWGDQFIGLRGLHEPMITPEENKKLKEIVAGRKTRIVRQHNPEFPMANQIYCECGGKFTGLMQGNGRGRFYPRYRCRKCGRMVKRDIVHSGIREMLSDIVFSEKNTGEILSALEVVWREDQRQNLEHVKNLKKRHLELLEQKTSLVMQLGKDQSLDEDIKIAIEATKSELTKLDDQIVDASHVEKDLIEFTKFAMRFIRDKANAFLEIDYETREKCKQLIFPEGIYVDLSEKVCTTEISPFLNLKSIKKEPKKDSNSILVDPRGFELLTSSVQTRRSSQLS